MIAWQEQVAGAFASLGFFGYWIFQYLVRGFRDTPTRGYVCKNCNKQFLPHKFRATHCTPCSIEIWKKTGVAI